MSELADCPSPGDRFEGRIVVASGWHSDEVIALLTMADEAPFYRVEQVPLEGETGVHHVRWTFMNIVPAAAWLEETSGLFGGSPEPVNEEVVA